MNKEYFIKFKFIVWTMFDSTKPERRKYIVFKRPKSFEYECFVRAGTGIQPDFRFYVI